MRNSGTAIDKFPPHVQAQIARELTPARNIEQAAREQAGIPPAKKRGRRIISQKHDGPNAIERAFFSYLQLRAVHERLEFEPVTLRLGNGVTFTPDIGGWNTVRQVYDLFDVKGHLEDDAAVKVKAAADRFPFFRLWLAQKKRKRDGGGWLIQEVQPWPPRVGEGPPRTQASGSRAK